MKKRRKSPGPSAIIHKVTERRPQDKDGKVLRVFLCGAEDGEEVQGTGVDLRVTCEECKAK